VRLIRVGSETHAIVHLIVDTQDAMGANLINTMCEGVAPLIERVSGGRVRLRILSNLADLRLARASCRIPFEALADFGFSGAEVAHGIGRSVAVRRRRPLPGLHAQQGRDERRGRGGVGPPGTTGGRSRPARTRIAPAMGATSR